MLKKVDTSLLFISGLWIIFCLCGVIFWVKVVFRKTVINGTSYVSGIYAVYLEKIFCWQNSCLSNA